MIPFKRLLALGLFIAGLSALGTALEGVTGGRAQRVTERTILEWDSGTLSAAEADAFAELVDRGVADVEALVGPSLPPSARRRGRLRFVVSPRAGISRTYGHTIVLPLERVRTRSAPYLHETVHALVPSRSDAVWLSEGLASYLESWVSENRGGYDAQVFTRAGDHGIHAAARRYLSSGQGRAVLPWVGGHGEPPRLEMDRSEVARPFYVLAHSFTKHVVDSTRLDAVVRTLASSDPEALRKATGRSGEEWRRSWLLAIGLSGSSPLPGGPAGDQ